MLTHSCTLPLNVTSKGLQMKHVARLCSFLSFFQSTFLHPLSTSFPPVIAYSSNHNRVAKPNKCPTAEFTETLVCKHSLFLLSDLNPVCVMSVQSLQKGPTVLVMLTWHHNFSERGVFLMQENNWSVASIKRRRGGPANTHTERERDSFSRQYEECVRRCCGAESGHPLPVFIAGVSQLDKAAGRRSRCG